MSSAARRIRVITASDLHLAAGLGSAGESGFDPFVAKAATDQWGLCGLLLSLDQRPVGYLGLAPVSVLPRFPGSVGMRLSADAAALLDVRVAIDHRGHGLGRQLVQAAAAELSRRDVPAIEAVASVDGTDGVPLGFCAAVGFRVVGAHPRRPRVRMDLVGTVRWRPDLVAAWQRLTGLVPHPAPPQPAGFTGPRQAELALSGR